MAIVKKVIGVVVVLLVLWGVYIMCNPEYRERVFVAADQLLAPPSTADILKRMGSEVDLMEASIKQCEKASQSARLKYQGMLTQIKNAKLVQEEAEERIKLIESGKIKDGDLSLEKRRLADFTKIEQQCTARAEKLKDRWEVTREICNKRKAEAKMAHEKIEFLKASLASMDEAEIKSMMDETEGLVRALKQNVNKLESEMEIVDMEAGL